MAQDNQEELLRMLLEHEKLHGEKGGWLLIALGLVYLGQLIRLVETRAALVPVAPPGKDAGSGGGLGDLLGLLGPLMSILKSPGPAGHPGYRGTHPEGGSEAGQGWVGVSPAPEAASPRETPHPPCGYPPEEPREEPRPLRNHDVIKWDPRLVGGARK